jgi:hypothetical protein
MVEFSDSFAESQDDEPLNVPEDIYEKARDFLPVYQLFFSEAHRWRNVHICVYRDLFRVHSSENLWPTSFPLLQSFFVHVFDSEDDSNDITPCLTLFETPFLEVLIHTGQTVRIKRYPGILTPVGSLRVASFMGSMCENMYMVGSLGDVTFRNVGYVERGRIPCLATGLHIVMPDPDRSILMDMAILAEIFEYVTLPNVVELSVEIRATTDWDIFS